jgi:DNA-binding response OmpR family regulator
MVPSDSAQGLRILLIDDDPSHAELVKIILSRQYNDSLVVCVTGLAGIEAAQESSPDLILVRLMLMDGMDGFEVCCRLKAISHLQQIPVLLFAAKLPQEVYEEAKLCGAAGYLFQPFSPDHLYKACETLLSGETYFP